MLSHRKPESRHHSAHKPLPYASPEESGAVSLEGAGLPKASLKTGSFCGSSLSSAGHGPWFPEQRGCQGRTCLSKGFLLVSSSFNAEPQTLAALREEAEAPAGLHSCTCRICSFPCQFPEPLHLHSSQPLLLFHGQWIPSLNLPLSGLPYIRLP